MFGTISDITQTKDAEEMVTRASLVFAHSSDAIAIADASGRIVMVNPGFTRMRGYDEDEVIGRSAGFYNADLERESQHAAMHAHVMATGHWLRRDLEPPQGRTLDRRRTDR